MEFIIRNAKQSDAKGLVALYQQFWIPHKDVDPLIALEKKMSHKNQILAAKKDIRKRDSHLLVAECNGTVIGYIEFFIKKNEDCFKIKNYGYVNAATTHKKYRGNGVAKALTTAALLLLKKKGIRFVRTNVYHSNDIAMRTWRTLGFKPQSTLLMKRI